MTVYKSGNNISFYLILRVLVHMKSHLNPKEVVTVTGVVKGALNEIVLVEVAKTV